MDSHVPRTVAPAGWSLTSWRNLPIKQQPKYADEAALEAALQEGVLAIEVRNRAANCGTP